MARKRRAIVDRMERERSAKLVGYGERAVKKARDAGVFLDPSVVSGYEPLSPDDTNWIFGPDKNKDNIYQAVPQVTLHGFDEGLVQKLNHGALETLITFCMNEHGIPAAQVRLGTKSDIFFYKNLTFVCINL